VSGTAPENAGFGLDHILRQLSWMQSGPATIRAVFLLSTQGRRTISSDITGRGRILMLWDGAILLESSWPTIH
jgi:hypothetical protein